MQITPMILLCFIYAEDPFLPYSRGLFLPQ